MREFWLVFRKKAKQFNSIENVFNILLPYLSVKKCELPHSSGGLIPRLKNIIYLRGQSRSCIHITGHDHYLLWWPFKKVVLTIHDIEALKRKSGWRKYLFQKLWFDWPIANASAITTISEFSKMELLSLRNYKTPISVIPNPVTLPLSYSPKEFNSDCPVILHIGTKMNKNLDRLVLSLSGISCQLIIIGQSSDHLEKLLNEHHIDYKFRSGLTNEGVMQEYKECDLLAFVSTYEGFGLPILEAQAVGRPVITSNVASMPEVAGDAAVLINPFSTNEIREGIQHLIKNKSLRDDLIRKGLQNVKRFDSKIIADMYLNLYQEVKDN